MARVRVSVRVGTRVWVRSGVSTFLYLGYVMAGGRRGGTNVRGKCAGGMSYTQILWTTLQRTRISWWRRRTRQHWKERGWGWSARPKLTRTTSPTSGSVTASTFTWWPGWWREPASTETAASSSAAFSAVTPAGIVASRPTDSDRRRQLMPSSTSPVSSPAFVNFAQRLSEAF